MTILIKIEVIRNIVDPYEQVTKRINDLEDNFNDLEKDKIDFFDDIKNYIVLAVSLDTVQPISGLYEEANHNIDSLIKNNIGWNYEGIIGLNLDSFDNLCHLIELDSYDIYELLKKYKEKVCDYSHPRNFYSWDNFISDENLPKGLSVRNIREVVNKIAEYQKIIAKG